MRMRIDYFQLMRFPDRRASAIWASNVGHLPMLLLNTPYSHVGTFDK